LCPENLETEPCTPGGVTYRHTTRSGTLQNFASNLAGAENVHVVVISGDRNYVPQGGSTASEHLTTDINPSAQGAIDFHAYYEDGRQVPDGALGSVAISSGRAETDGVRLILHGPGTNTEGPHLHADTRTDIGHRYETGGTYTPWSGTTMSNHVPHATPHKSAFNLF
jgi:hypothetical protein